MTGTPPAATPVFHGGDIAWATREFGTPSAPWIDLSTGINPFPYQVGMTDQALWTRLPDSEAETALRQAAAACYGAPGPECIAAAPGSQMLIQLLPRLRPSFPQPARVAVIGPTYGEHAPGWRAAGHLVTEVDGADEAALDGDWDVVVLTNPNNPDGRAIARRRIEALGERIGNGGGWVVVDEAFADTAPEISVAGRVETPGLIVLRSFGKFFGLAGLRLGFAIAAGAMAAEIRTALGPWAFSGIAGHVARLALSDTAWIEAMRARLDAHAAALDTVLTGAGFGIIGGTSLFRLARHDQAAEIFRRLAAAGILARHFPERPDRLRFGLPGGDREMERLRRALAP